MFYWWQPSIIKRKLIHDLLFNLGNTLIKLIKVWFDNNGIVIYLNKSNFLKFNIYNNSTKNYPLFFHNDNCKQISDCDSAEIKKNYKL